MNTPAIAEVTAQRVLAGTWRRLSEVLRFSDAEGDAVTHVALWDGTGTSTWWADGALVGLGQTHVTGRLSDIWFRGDPFASQQTLWLRPYDGTEWGDWESFDLTTRTGNVAPTASVEDVTVGLGERTALRDVLSVRDADGDDMLLYSLWDASGSDNWTVDGRAVDASGGFLATDLSGIAFRGDASAGAQTLWIRVYDGIDWSDWDRFTLTTRPDNAPPALAVTDPALVSGGSAALSDIIAVSDADGDAILRYALWDADGGGNWSVDGVRVDASRGFVTQDVSGIRLLADAAPSEQTVWIRAFDGTDWSAWESIRLVTLQPNAPPVVAVPDLTVTPLEWVPLSGLVRIEDAEGDPILRYELRDASGADNWYADGAIVPAGTGYVTSDLSGVRIRGDASSGTQTLEIRAFDGTDWSAWESFVLTTEARGDNSAPVVDMPDVTVRGAGGAGYATLNALIEIADPDGDAITAIALRDATGLHNVNVDGIGRVDARAGYVVSDPDTLIWLDGDLLIDPGASPSSQVIEVRAHDGTEWGDWTAFTLHSLAGGA